MTDPRLTRMSTRIEWAQELTQQRRQSLEHQAQMAEADCDHELALAYRDGLSTAEVCAFEDSVGISKHIGWLERKAHEILAGEG